MTWFAQPTPYQPAYSPHSHLVCSHVYHDSTVLFAGVMTAAWSKSTAHASATLTSAPMATTRRTPCVRFACGDPARPTMPTTKQSA